jgi:hypothetical protein
MRKHRGFSLIELLIAGGPELAPFVVPTLGLCCRAVPRLYEIMPRLAYASSAVRFEGSCPRATRLLLSAYADPVESTP